MKHISTKKYAIIVAALLLVGVLVFCVACQDDPYAGNYQPVTDENREAVVANATAKLEEIKENGLDKIKFTYKNKPYDETNEQISTSNIEMTMVVDGEKMRVDLNYDVTEDGVRTTFTSTVWIDNEFGEAWYKVVVDGETLEGKYDSSTNTNAMVSMAVFTSGLGAPMALGQVFELLASVLENDDVELYADGDNIRMSAKADDVDEEESYKGECELYLIFGTDGTFRFKLEDTSEVTRATSKSSLYIFAEILSSTETVTMPDFD